MAMTGVSRSTRPRAMSLMETVVAAFVIALIVAAVIECGLQALRAEHRDYELTTVHTLCQERMEDAVFKASDPNQYDALLSDAQPFSFIGDNNGNGKYWVYQRVVNPLDRGLKRVSVTIWLADAQSPTPAPKGRPLERLTTVVTRP